MESAVKLQSTFRGKKGRDLAKELEEKKAAVAARTKEAEQLESTARRLSAAAEDLDSQAAAAAAEEEAAVAAEAAAAAAAAEVEERAKAATKLQALPRQEGARGGGDEGGGEARGGEGGGRAVEGEAREDDVGTRRSRGGARGARGRRRGRRGRVAAQVVRRQRDGVDEGAPAAAEPRREGGRERVEGAEHVPRQAGTRAAAGEARAAAEEEKAQAQAAAILQSGYRGKMSRPGEVASGRPSSARRSRRKRRRVAAAALELEKNEAAETAANLVVGAEQQRVLAAEAPPAFIQSLCKCLCEFQGTVSPKSLEEAKVAEEEGRKEMDGKHYKEALQNFVHAHAMVPTKPLYLLLAANAHRVLGHDEAARTLYDFVLTSPSSRPTRRPRPRTTSPR